MCAVLQTHSCTRSLSVCTLLFQPWEWKMKLKSQTFPLIPSTERRGKTRNHHIFYSWEMQQRCHSKYVAYERVFTLVDILQLRNAVWFSKYQTLLRRWHFRQQVSHAWKMPQSTDGALKWLHRNRTNVTDRFNYLDVTFMTNADRTEKREKCGVFGFFFLL